MPGMNPCPRLGPPRVAPSMPATSAKPSSSARKPFLGHGPADHVLLYAGCLGALYERTRLSLCALLGMRVRRRKEGIGPRASRARHLAIGRGPHASRPLISDPELV